jgi:hypothetical protein
MARLKALSRKVVMTRLASLTLCIALLLSAGGCASRTQQTEDLLAASGFRVKLADTPKLVAQLNSLPPQTIAIRNRNGQPVFLYADPQVCKCLYYGDQVAYDTYRRNALAQHIAQQNEEAAMLAEDASWDWQGWGYY